MKKNKVKDLFIDTLRKTPIISVAAEKTNISTMSISRWRKADPKFAEAMDEALAQGETLLNDLGEAQIVSLMKDKHWPAIAFWLSRRHPKFREKLEISGDITHRERREMSDEEKGLIKEALRLAMPKDKRSESGEGATQDHGTDH